MPIERDLVMVVDDDGPTPCRHCGALLTMRTMPTSGAIYWIDGAGRVSCGFNRAHAPLPDPGDIDVAAWEAGGGR